MYLGILFIARGGMLRVDVCLKDLIPNNWPTPGAQMLLPPVPQYFA